jgi:4,5-dihydroxyphthalate decarboxylase
MVLLPNVVLARFQHAYAVYRAELGNLRPCDLEGRRVGIRSFTTTTGAWLRGILANDYGVDLNAINWVTFEDAHVAEFRDTTQRAPEGKEIIQMLLDGELDAVLGEKVERPLKPLFSDAAAEERSWFAKHKVLPINHMVVVSANLSKDHPGAVREVFRLLQASASLASPAAAPNFSAEDMRRSLELIIQYTAEQGLIPRAFAVDELFDDLTRSL